MREGFRHVQENAYQYEDSIIWLLPEKGLRVREKIITTSNRTRKPRGKYAGYSTLFPETPNNGRAGRFYRRVFIDDPDGLSVDKIVAGVSFAKCN
jgi:hypothetical protein